MVPWYIWCTRLIVHFNSLTGSPALPLTIIVQNHFQHLESTKTFPGFKCLNTGVKSRVDDSNVTPTHSNRKHRNTKCLLVNKMIDMVFSE